MIWICSLSRYGFQPCITYDKLKNQQSACKNGPWEIIILSMGKIMDVYSGFFKLIYFTEYVGKHAVVSSAEIFSAGI